MLYTEVDPWTWHVFGSLLAFICYKMPKYPTPLKPKTEIDSQGL